MGREEENRGSQGLGGFGALFLDGRGRGLVPKSAGGLKS